MLRDLSPRAVVLEHPGSGRAYVSRLLVLQDTVIIATLSAPPTSPVTDAVYRVGASPTGPFAGRADQLAVWHAGWYFFRPWTGLRAWSAETSRWAYWDDALGEWTTSLGIGSLTVDNALLLTREVLAAGSTGQGAAPVSKPVTVVTPVSGANDDVTLPSLEAHKVLVVLNRGSITLNVYPASGDQIEALGVNNPATIASGAGALLAGDTSVWRKAGLSI